MATGKCRPANVNRQVFVGKLSQRVSICPNMSHRVPNSSFCWRLASVGRQMSTVKCLSANCLKESQPVPACLTESQTVASVGDRQVSAGKCQQFQHLSTNCLKEFQSVSTCLTESQTVASVGDWQVSAGKCQQSSVCRQTASKSPNLSQHVSQSPKQ